MDLGFPIQQYLVHIVVVDALLIVALLSYLWLRGRIDRRRLEHVQSQRFAGRSVKDGGVLRRAGRPLRDNRKRNGAPSAASERPSAGVFVPPQRQPRKSPQNPDNTASAAVQSRGRQEMENAAGQMEAPQPVADETSAPAAFVDSGPTQPHLQAGVQSAASSGRQPVQSVDSEKKAVADACARRLLDLASELEKQKKAVAEFIASGETLDLERLRSLRAYRSVVIRTDKDKLHLLSGFVADDINDVYVEVAEWDSAFDRLLEMAHQQPLEPAWSEVIEKKLTSTISKMEEVIAELTTNAESAAALH